MTSSRYPIHWGAEAQTTQEEILTVDVKLRRDESRGMIKSRDGDEREVGREKERCAVEGGNEAGRGSWENGLFELRANGAAPSAQSMADALVLVPLRAPSCLPLFSPHTLWILASSAILPLSSTVVFT